MIIVEGTLWPVIFLGAIEDSALVPRDACIVTEDKLASTQKLAFGVVVAGKGDTAMRSQRAALRWLDAHEDLVRSNGLRLAWVIEDERIQAWTDAWLGCMGQVLFAVHSRTFRTVAPALSWLLSAASPRADREERDWMTVRARMPAMPVSMTRRMVSGSR